MKLTAVDLFYAEVHCSAVAETRSKVCNQILSFHCNIERSSKFKEMRLILLHKVLCTPYIELSLRTPPYRSRVFAPGAGFSPRRPHSFTATGRPRAFSNSRLPRPSLHYQLPARDLLNPHIILAIQPLARMRLIKSFFMTEP